MADEIFRKTKEYFERLAETAEGKKLLGMYDQTIGFEVAREDQVMEITRKYYFPKYSGPPCVGEERFIIDIKGGKLDFRPGEDVPLPASNRKDFTQYIKLLAVKKTFLDIYEGRLKPLDALIPEAEQPTRLNILPFLPKWAYASWIARLLLLIANQNQERIIRP